MQSIKPLSSRDLRPGFRCNEVFMPTYLLPRVAVALLACFLAGLPVDRTCRAAEAAIPPLEAAKPGPPPTTRAWNAASPGSSRISGSAAVGSRRPPAAAHSTCRRTQGPPSPCWPCRRAARFRRPVQASKPARGGGITALPQRRPPLYASRSSRPPSPGPQVPWSLRSSHIRRAPRSGRSGRDG